MSSGKWCVMLCLSVRHDSLLTSALYKLFTYLHTHVTYTRLTALFPGLPGWADTRKVKPIWILLKQLTLSGTGISWAICKSAPCSRQITMPVPQHSSFLQGGYALPAAQPTASKHWRQTVCLLTDLSYDMNFNNLVVRLKPRYTFLAGTSL